MHLHSYDTNHGSFKALRGQKANHLKPVPEVIEEKALYVDGDTLSEVPQNFSILT